MKQTIIPAGYRLTVETWENDADNYGTEVLEGLSYDKVEIYVAVAKLFTSKNNPKDGGGLGNMYDPSAAEQRKVAEAAKTLVTRFPEMLEHDADSRAAIDVLMAWADDLGICGSDDFYTRVVDSWKVERIEQPIVLEDVTESFK